MKNKASLADCGSALGSWRSDLESPRLQYGLNGYNRHYCTPRPLVASLPSSL